MTCVSLVTCHLSLGPSCVVHLLTSVLHWSRTRAPGWGGFSCEICQPISDSSRKDNTFHCFFERCLHERFHLSSFFFFFICFCQPLRYVFRFFLSSVAGVFFHPAPVSLIQGFRFQNRGSAVFVPKKFSALLTRYIGNIGNCIFFCEEKKKSNKWRRRRKKI